MDQTNASPHHERILIVDFGSQVTQLIARRLREDGIYCEIHPYTKADTELLSSFKPKGIILSGGPNSVTSEDRPNVASLLEHGVPVLGICYGQQVMVAELGGQVEVSGEREFGRAELEVRAEVPLFANCWGEGGRYQVWMSHGDRVTNLPDGFQTIGISENAPFAAIADEERQFYGVQFHPEVVHTLDGARLLSNFTRNICGLAGDWTMAAFREEMIAKIKAQVGDAKVICGLSGGVDSAVAAVLIHEAIGDQLTCVFVDTGLMRLHEGQDVVDLFRGSYNIPLIHIEAENDFLGELSGVSEPETKRKIIGRVFVEIFETEAKQIDGARFLAQGTLYPDVIESVSATGGPSVTIKSHHNVGGLPERMGLDLVEPLRELFKDEVRALGRELGLPDAFVSRHPFPGPGLAIRLPGEITKEAADLLRKADHIYLEAIREEGLYNEIWQAFSVLLPVRTVGVMGDARTYDQVLALRAVTSTDGMTADTYPFTHDFLSRVSTKIINNCEGIGRVVYDITSKPPGTIEWE